MRRHRSGRPMAMFVAALLLTAGVGHGAPVLAGQPAAKDPAQGYIVRLRDGAPASEVAAAHHARHGARVTHVYSHAVNGYAARLSPDAARNIARDPDVVAVEPDRPVVIATQRLPTGVNRVDADRSPTADIDGIRGAVDADIAVLDTGIDVDHPDLTVAGGVGCVGSEPGIDDLNGHGTHVAGTAAAMDNQRGVVGVAPGARLWSVKVLDRSGAGTSSSVICGIDWVTTHAGTIEVANMSFEGSGDDGPCDASALHEALCRSVAAGVTYTAAAGNRATDAAATVPATYDEVLTVSALADFDGRGGRRGSPTCEWEVDDTFAYFSNFGPDVDLIAPGLCIRSTWPGGRYAVRSGTSMAAPHVAGGVALLLATRPLLRPAEVHSALLASARANWVTGSDPDAIPDRLLTVASL